MDCLIKSGGGNTLVGGSEEVMGGGGQEAICICYLDPSLSQSSLFIVSNSRRSLWNDAFLASSYCAFEGNGRGAGVSTLFRLWMSSGLLMKNLYLTIQPLHKHWNIHCLGIKKNTERNKRQRESKSFTKTDWIIAINNLGHNYYCKSYF